MFRIAGAVLVVIGCTGLGFRYRQELKEGLRSLYQIRQIMELMISEISYSKATLPECCRQAGLKSEEPYRSALISIYEQITEKSGVSFAGCWQEEMGKCLKGLPVSAAERDMVLGFAECSGLTDNRMQIRAIEQYRDMIDSAIRTREQNVAQQGRMAAGLGVMSGLLLTIILI